MLERWRDIPDYEGLYQVSDFGRVRRLAGWIHSHNAKSGRRRWAGRVLKPGYAGRNGIMRLCFFLKTERNGTGTFTIL